MMRPEASVRYFEKAWEEVESQEARVVPAAKKGANGFTIRGISTNGADAGAC